VPSKSIKLKALFFAVLFLFNLPAWSADSVSDHPVAVYLDPHYGGRENGPVFTKQAKGKDVTLALARAIQLELAQSNIKAYLSREDDVYIPRGDRWFFAKKKGADLYLSIRLSLQDRDCIQLYHAIRQPGALKSESGKDMTKESAGLAGALAQNLKNSAPKYCAVVRTKKDVIFETADFPAVIVEIGVARAERQRAYVLDPDKSGELARAIAAGIKAFIEGMAK